VRIPRGGGSFVDLKSRGEEFTGEGGNFKKTKEKGPGPLRPRPLKRRKIATRNILKGGGSNCRQRE